MSKHNKIITISQLDLFNLEEFFNKMAQEGYHFVEYNFFRMKFEYNPQSKMSYTIMTNEIDNRLFSDDQSKLEMYKLDNLIDDLEYRFIDQIGQFKVYVSKHSTPFYTDEKLTDKQSKKLALKEILISLIITIIGGSFLKRNLSPINLLSDSLLLVRDIFFVGFLLLVIFHGLKAILFYFGRRRWKSIKFRSIKTDLISLLLLLFGIGFIFFYSLSVILKSPEIIPFAIVLTVIGIVLYFGLDQSKTILMCSV